MKGADCYTVQTEGLIERKMEKFDYKTIRLDNEAINGQEFEKNVTSNDDSRTNKTVRLHLAAFYL